MKGILLLLIVFLRLAAASNRTEPCPADGEFRCRSSGRCIPVLWLCDGARDCAEGEDESEWRCHRHNHTRCSGDQPECGMPDGTFRCILHQWLCDGHDDCEDGSDERGCETKPPDLPSSGHLLESVASPKCSPSEFRCAAGSCISRDLVCDDVPHCPDGSDESEDRCAMPPRVGVPEPVHEDVDEGNSTSGFSMPENPFDLPDDGQQGSRAMNATTNKDAVENEPTNPFVERGESKDISGTRDLSPPNSAVGGSVQSEQGSASELDNKSATNGASIPQPPNATTVHSPLQPSSADSAFQPQIDDFDLLSQPSKPIPEIKEAPVIEDGNQAPPPDPFPFDLANYEIPEAEEPEQGHDEMGGTGMGPTRAQSGIHGSENVVQAGTETGPAGPVPTQKQTGASGKAIEELQLANVLQFMSNETKKLLKSINATKGHAVHSYKTLRNKSEVHSLSSYHHLPGLYAKLLPFEEITKNGTEMTEKTMKRVKREPVRIRAIPYISRSSELKTKREVDEKSKNDTKEEKNEKEVTLPPIVPLQLHPLEGQPIAPIIPANAEEIAAKKNGEPEEQKPETKKESTEKEVGSKPVEDTKEKELSNESITSSTSSTRSMQTTLRLGANEDPIGEIASGSKPLPPIARNSSDSGKARALAMIARSERLFTDGAREMIVKDERKELPRRIQREEYRDDGEGSMD